jgi:type III secretory pathway component EscU
MQDAQFNDVQEAARKRAANNINSEQLARQIVAAARGDHRIAYDFMDTLNRHVTLMLQGKKQ